MKISVIIPAYNEEALIGQCIRSVLASIRAANLAPEEAEVIVVNNASTDRTEEIARGFPHVRVLTEPTKGLTHAKQAGFLAARGDIVAHPDADTLMPEPWIAWVLEAFKKNNKIVAVTGPYIYYDLPLYARILSRLYTGVGFVTHIINHHILHIGAMVQGGNYAVRRKALEQIGGYDTSIAFYGEDTDIAKRLTRVGKVWWTWQLPMRSSGRRFAQEGIMTIGMRYALNYVWVTITKKPLTRDYIDVRPK